VRQSKGSCRGWTIRLRLVKRHSRRGSIVENLRHGAGATWTRDTLRSLSAGKNYLKSVYKSHLGLKEPCTDHCTVFALSNPIEDKFSGVLSTVAHICKHNKQFLKHKTMFRKHNTMFLTHNTIFLKHDSKL